MSSGSTTADEAGPASRAAAGPQPAADTSGASVATGDADADPVIDLERIVIGAVGVTTEAFERAGSGVELTFSQWRALLILGEPPNGARVGEVAARVGVTLPATSRLLRRLARRDLVALAPDETDRRATRARLTAHGREVRDSIVAFRRAVLNEIAATAGATRSATATRAIRKLAGAFDRYA